MNAVKHYLFIGGEQVGPFGFSQLKAMYQRGELTLDTLHFMDGYSEWLPLSFIADDFADKPAGADHRKLQKQVDHANGMDYPPRSRGIYILMGLFFLGLLGGHNFYAGRYSRGVAQMLITLCLFWLILPLFVVAIWVIIELFTVTKDGRGKMMI